MKNLITAFGLLFVLLASAQDKAALNHYQYAIVPAQFSFLKQPDQYRLNTYLKLHLQKYGFKAYLDNEDLPMEVMMSKCNKVYVNLLEDSGMLTTKIKVQFKDCLGNVLYVSDEGLSREKDFAKGYREALGKAFESFVSVGYKYDGTTNHATDGEMVATSKQTAAQSKTSDAAIVVDKNTLFAQPTDSGYQLVDTTPTVIFKLQKTSSRDVFMAQKGELSGTLIKKDSGVWTFEYYKDGQLATEQVKIKF